MNKEQRCTEARLAIQAWQVNHGEYNIVMR